MQHIQLDWMIHIHNEKRIEDESLSFSEKKNRN